MRVKREEGEDSGARSDAENAYRESTATVEVSAWRLSGVGGVIEILDPETRI